MDCYCDYDPPEVFSQCERKARKQHRCGECGRAIQAGEQYEYVWGVWDGDAAAHKTCPRCLEIRRFVQASVPCFCWGYGNLKEDARNTAEEYSREADGLLFGTLRRLIIAERAPAYVATPTTQE